MTITKKDIAKMTQELCDYELSDACAKDVVDSVLSAIMNYVAHGDRVQLHNFGVFSKRKYKEFIRHYAKTGKDVVVNANEKICFNPSKTFKEFIRQ